MKLCSREGCSRISIARGYCSSHYSTWSYQNNPEYRQRRREAHKKRSDEREYGKRRVRQRKENAKVFLLDLYQQLQKSVRGKTRLRRYHKNLPLLPKKDFLTLSINDKKFNRLFRSWRSSSNDPRLTPSPDRLNRDDGWVSNNIEWVTNEERNRRSMQITHRIMGRAA